MSALRVSAFLFALILPACNQRKPAAVTGEFPQLPPEASTVAQEARRDAIARDAAHPAIAPIARATANAVHDEFEAIQLAAMVVSRLRAVERMAKELETAIHQDSNKQIHKWAQRLIDVEDVYGRLREIASYFGGEGLPF
jgi:hypothetical protein